MSLDNNRINSKINIDERFKDRLKIIQQQKRRQTKEKLSKL